MCTKQKKLKSKYYNTKLIFKNNAVSYAKENYL